MPQQGRQKLLNSKSPAAKHVVAKAFPAQTQPCAVPLLSATPTGNTHYTLHTVTPPKDQVGPMVYAQTAPTCGEAGR